VLYQLLYLRKSYWARYTFGKEGEFKPKISIFNINFIPVEVGVTEFEMVTSAAMEYNDFSYFIIFIYSPSPFCISPFVDFFAFSFFLDTAMNAITSIERLIATNPAGNNDELKESALNLPRG
jgi:hypothetical protein